MLLSEARVFIDIEIEDFLQLVAPLRVDTYIVVLKHFDYRNFFIQQDM